MSKKQQKHDRQLSLDFDAADCPTRTISARLNESVVIAFPSHKNPITSFRERVIGDLIRNRVIVDR